MGSIGTQDISTPASYHRPEHTFSYVSVFWSHVATSNEAKPGSRLAGRPCCCLRVVNFHLSLVTHGPQRGLVYRLELIMAFTTAILRWFYNWRKNKNSMKGTNSSASVGLHVSKFFRDLRAARFSCRPQFDDILKTSLGSRNKKIFRVRRFFLL